MLDEYNYDPDYSVTCIEANRHNQITATYHLLTKKMLKKDKNFLDDEPSNVNHLGSVDRNQKPTRLQQIENQDQTKAQAHKRGHSIAVGAAQPINSIQPTVNINNLNNAKDTDISA